ncbi:hypothetical protein [Marinibacterium profundimaris]|uniref:Uncharacterized protein n=1 Tax=Marinibacterium profundimaris TaxID=1679460 RepID=A0A225NLQ5_9RHOB|nr:hypothetical protein [Marinibacterium profundimaris]OWU74997.1 hypothetical protein ATO3_10675 [Marinibacterium profundimaris]
MATADTTLSVPATPAPIALQPVRDSGADAPVCPSLMTALTAAFEAAITAEFGPVTVTDTPAGGRACLRFVTERQGRSVLSGHLAWQRADGESGTGPTLTLSVSDADLDVTMLDRFARDLLRISKLHL